MDKLSCEQIFSTKGPVFVDKMCGGRHFTELRQQQEERRGIKETAPEPAVAAAPELVEGRSIEGSRDWKTLRSRRSGGA